MKSINQDRTNLYLTDEYIKKNPSLHAEDSPWKVSKIMPLIERFMGYVDKDEINLLDVGGGAGLILNATSTYIKERYGIKVNKFALDLSPGMLEAQKKSNPDLKKALNEDIRKNSLGNKEIDLTLMIDLLEHVPDPAKALEEAKRISEFVLFKVPLEDNLVCKTWNCVKRGQPRQHAIETVGHINVYNFYKLKYELEKHTGQVLDSHFTNAFEYVRNSEHYNSEMSKKGKLISSVAVYMFRVSPRLCSFIFGDSAMILVKCY